MLCPECVYGDISPDRQWQGQNTLEIGRLAVKEHPDIDESCYLESQLLMYFRGAGKRDALAAVPMLRQILDDIGQIAEANHRNLDAAWEESLEVFPLIDGMTVQEQFATAFKLIICSDTL